MRLTLAFTGAKPLAVTLPLVRAADTAQLDGVWVAEHLGRRDATVPACVYALESARLDVALVGLSTAGRHPGLLATEVASLCELAPGRIRIAVGTGEPRLVERLGRRPQRPVAAVAALVAALRALLRGEEVTASHDEFALERFSIPAPAVEPAIDVMAVRPGMLRLSARIADGAVLSARTSRTYLRETVELLERELAATGRERNSFRITALADAVIADDLAPGRDDVARSLAATPQRPAAYRARGVADPDELALAEAAGPRAVARAWTAERIDQIALVARPEDVRTALRAYADTGIDELGVVLRGPPADAARAVRLLAEARP